MRPAPIVDALDLWRGVDDAVWREAGRPRRPLPPPPLRPVPVPAPRLVLQKTRPSRPRQRLGRVTEPA